MDSIVEILFQKLSEAYELTEIDAGVYASARVSVMKFTIKAYYAKGLGHVCLMSGKGILGLAGMKTLVVNPFERDMALFSYDSIRMAGNNTLLLEIYDTCLNQNTDGSESKETIRSLCTSRFDEIVGRYTVLKDGEYAPNWYDSIKWDCSTKKLGKKKDVSDMTNLASEYFDAYLAACKEAPACDKEAKKARASQYTEGLLKNGGPSTDQFIKAKGREYTGTMFRNIMFGTR